MGDLFIPSVLPLLEFLLKELNFWRWLRPFSRGGHVYAPNFAYVNQTGQVESLLHLGIW